MKAVASACELFFERLRSSRERLLLLDYDGTLAPFHADRDLALPYPGIPRLVGKIMNKGTRVVLVTGRPAQELVLLSGIFPHPEIWGSHGWERLRPNGEYELARMSEAQKAALREAARLMKVAGLLSRTEVKPGGVAVHWRGMSTTASEQIRDQVLRNWSALQEDSQVRVTEFDGGLEMRPLGRDKGNAISDILGECGSQALAAYLGDDLTDEDAFRALKGRGLAVLVRSESRPTTADLWLKPPHELTGFLEEWLCVSGGQA